MGTAMPEQGAEAVADPGRRRFLCRTATGLAALSTLLQDQAAARSTLAEKPRAKRIIYLFQGRICRSRFVAGSG